MDYSAMLKKGREELPDIVSVRDRFEIPKIKGHLQGNKTIVSNFLDVCKTLGREPPHVLKYLLKELATSGEIQRSHLIFNTKLSANGINKKIRQYANTFVICPACGKPDTAIITERNVKFLKCSACGTKTHIRM